MKKLFLLSALALGMASANAADFSEYFTVKYHGETVKNGDTVTVDPEDLSEILGDEYNPEEWGYSYAAHVTVVNNQNEPRPMFAQFSAVEPAKPSGSIALCTSGSFDVPDNCFGNGQTTLNVAPAGSAKELELLCDLNFTFEMTPVLCKLVLIAMEGDAKGDCEEIDGADFELFLNCDPAGLNGIGSMAVENAPAEYYTMQGVRVANPDKGMYIVKQGSKVTKRAF